MPEIVFKGKEPVYNHHLTVPHRPLVTEKFKGVGPADLNSNLVIHGDNLHALKALLPRYAGKVDLVFIDPPYNTGNEGWCYNDKVNSPIMKEWLSTNPVDTRYKQALLAQLTAGFCDERFKSSGELALTEAGQAELVCDLVFDAGWKAAMDGKYFSKTA